MRRIIKVRAWHVVGFDDNDEEVYGMIYDLAFEDYEPIDDLLNGLDHLMQYTGVNDASDRNIYEGDIVVAEAYPFFNDGKANYVGVIEWVEAGFYVVMRVRSGAAVRGISDGIAGRLEAENSFTVIGNIYENPELLEEPN